MKIVVQVAVDMLLIHTGLPPRAWLLVVESQSFFCRYQTRSLQASEPLPIFTVFACSRH
jgi:hypothetical protein